MHEHVKFSVYVYRVLTYSRGGLSCTSVGVVRTKIP